MSVEHERYRVHVATECEAVERGAWCDRCHELCLLADAADWEVIRIAIGPEPPINERALAEAEAVLGIRKEKP